MRVQVLGPVEVRRDGELLPLGGPKQRQVLACLIAARSQMLSVDALAEDLWGNDPPATAPHVVSTYVSGLRKVLGQRIRSAGASHGFVPAAGDAIDAWQLERAVRRARALAGSDPAAALAQLPDGRGAGRPFGDLADVSELLRTEARRLEEVMLQAAEARIDLELRLGRHEDVLPELEVLCARNPYREGLHAQRMLALYRADRQVEALEVFRALRDTLGEELGLDPSADVTELQLRILLQDDALLLVPPHVLPTPLSDFIGREQQIASVAALLSAHRLVTLVGPGGVGKTRLAIEVARAGLARFGAGTWWVDLATIDRPDQAPWRIAAALGLPEMPGTEPTEAVRAFLSPSRALLVLDNCEHLLPDLAGTVGRLLEGTPELRVLVTSRRALGIPGENRITVEPLGPEEAARLFATRAREAGATQARLAGAGETIGRICRRLDRLPLAIELAASRSAALSVEEIDVRLEADRMLQGAELSGVADTHRTLDAAIGWGYGLLDPRQRRTLARLAVFEGTFDLAAATAVAGCAEEDVTALVESSLLALEPGPSDTGAYRMLETVRSFGRARLVDQGALDQARRAHALHHLDLFEAAGWDRLTPGFADWMPRLEAAEVETAAALGWAEAHLAPGRRAEAAPGLFEYWFRRGDPVPAYRFGVRLLEAGEPLAPRLEAAARLCAGFGGAFVGDRERATTGLDRAVEVLEGDDDWRGLVWVLLGRGQNATVLGDLGTAVAMGHRILEVCAQRGADLPRAYGLALLGEAEFLRGGDLAQARRWTEEAIAGFRELRDPASLNLFGLGIASGACALQGDVEAAERYALEATTLPGPGWRATAYVILGGWVLPRRGETVRAVAAVRRGVLLAHRMSLALWVRHGLLMLARLAAQQEQWEDAALLFGAAHPQPPWGQAEMWWEPQALVRAALGADRFDALSAAGAARPLDQWMDVLTADTSSADPADRSVRAQ